jgi:hypothetical protein
MPAAAERKVSRSYFFSFVFEVPSIAFGINGSVMRRASTPREYRHG